MGCLPGFITNYVILNISLISLAYILPYKSNEYKCEHDILNTVFKFQQCMVLSNYNTYILTFSVTYLNEEYIFGPSIEALPKS